MIEEDLSKTTLESFLLSIKSLRNTNLSEELTQIDVPVMGIYGMKDVIVHPNQYQMIETAKRPHVHTLPQAGHFPMLDEPENFMLIIKEFLDTNAAMQ